jgi:hypothetical protein
VYPVCFSSFRGGRRCPNCKFKSEKLSREIFERLVGHKFPKRRPNFLQGLEFDGYCSELGIAFEYNGLQHYEICNVVRYDSEERLDKRKENDKLKAELCEKNGIKLCVIPYTYNCYDQIKLEEFIRCWILEIGL